MVMNDEQPQGLSTIKTDDQSFYPETVSSIALIKIKDIVEA